MTAKNDRNTGMAATASAYSALLAERDRLRAALAATADTLADICKASRMLRYTVHAALAQSDNEGE